MSLPLTYDDGTNLLPKRCDQDEAYFACELTSEYNLTCDAFALSFLLSTLKSTTTTYKAIGISK